MLRVLPMLPVLPQLKRGGLIGCLAHTERDGGPAEPLACAEGFAAPRYTRISPIEAGRQPRTVSIHIRTK